MSDKTYSKQETEHRYRAIIRGALNTRPISNEEIIAKSKIDDPDRVRHPKKKKKPAKASSSRSSHASAKTARPAS